MSEKKKGVPRVFLSSTFRDLPSLREDLIDRLIKLINKRSNSNDRMSIRESISKSVEEIWEEIEEPLVIIISGTVLLFVTALFLKIGILVLHLFFTEESWFLQYLDILSISVLILSYMIFVIMRLVAYSYLRTEELRGRRGETT